MLTEVEECGTPQFGLVDEIFVDNIQQVYVGLKMMDTTEYSAHFHSWIVCPKDAKLLHKLDNPSLHWPRAIWNNGPCLHVTLKYAL